MFGSITLRSTRLSGLPILTVIDGLRCSSLHSFRVSSAARVDRTRAPRARLEFAIGGVLFSRSRPSLSRRAGRSGHKKLDAYTSVPPFGRRVGRDRRATYDRHCRIVAQRPCAAWLLEWLDVSASSKVLDVRVRLGGPPATSYSRQTAT